MLTALRRNWVALLLGAPLLLALLPGCGESPAQKSPPRSTTVSDAPAPPNALELVFTYGSEKQKWIEEVTAPFNSAQHKSDDGRVIYVRAIPMGSGEAIDEAISERRQVHLVSPASGAFITLGNAQSRSKSGKELVGETKNLVISPVVIAMWQPMAEAIGWPKKAVGWSDVLDLARNPEGWVAHGHPEWGKFKLGHTHPDFSNSGLIATFAEVYAAAGKTKDLAPADLEKPDVTQYVHDIEASIVHYGSSTGFFSNKMFANGPQYLSAAVLYENLVIDSYSNNPATVFPVVAVYPKEGTFWSDHPVGIVSRPWVTAAHRKAAEQYIQYLLDKPQQERAMAYGFRPSDPQIALAAPIDAEHGVNVKEPKTTLEVPSVEVIDGINKLWRQNKKHASVMLVFDTSGSMMLESRMVNARIGAAELVKLMDDDDEISLLPFNNVVPPPSRPVRLADGREQISKRISQLYPDGGTSLYDAIDVAFQQLQSHPPEGKISAIVVLTDGADEGSRLSLAELLKHIQFNAEKQPVRIFTIGYGNDARKDVLEQISNATQGKFYAGKPENIREVFKEIATFF